ncbi:MAG: hypothetical protein ACFFAK_01165 [Promethearchaeota archaeon]
MEIMRERNRNKIITDAKKYGGIGLRGQLLRVHKNGAKFTISKVYLEDKLINPEIPYTLILVPEARVTSKSGVILSYFDRKLGPLVFYSYPEDAFSERERNFACNLMDKAFDEKFFTYQTIFFSSMNYYFEIDSNWSRGNKEMLMVSIVLNTPINAMIEDKIELVCQEFASKVQKTENLFMGFHLNEMNRFKGAEQEIQTKIEVLKSYIKEFCNNIYVSIKEIKENNKIYFSEINFKS